jgi:hypothetical protein
LRITPDSSAVTTFLLAFNGAISALKNCHDRNTSATDQACAGHPPGGNGASPPKTSPNIPSPLLQIVFPKGSRKLCAIAASRYTL